MSVSVSEEARQQKLDELAAELGPGWRDNYKPGTFGCHELLDRTHQAAEAVERLVLLHPACVRDSEWFALAEQAVDALQELYQRVGEQHMDAPNGPSSEAQ